jgi:hypothetical protein
MARSRIIKPGFFRNEDLAELPAMTRLLFAGLWTLADKEGRLEDRPKRIRADVFPYDDLTGADVHTMLHELAAGGFIQRYSAAGCQVIAIVKWHDHQQPHHKEADSELPGPDEAEPQVVDAVDVAKHESRLSQACFKLEPSMDQACGELEPSSLLVTSNKKQVSSNKPKKKKWTPIPLDELPDAIRESETLRDAVIGWTRYKAERGDTVTPTGLQSFLTQVQNKAAEYGADAVAAAMVDAAANGWQGWHHTLGQESRAGPRNSGGSRRHTEITPL